MSDLIPRITIITDASVRFMDIHSSGEKGRGYSTGAAILIDDDSGKVLGEYSQYFGELSVGEAEYQAVILGLSKASDISRGFIRAWSDSQFVVDQLNGEARVRGGKIRKLYYEAKRLEQKFLRVKYFHHNRASFLARKAHNLAEKEYKQSLRPTV